MPVFILTIDGGGARGVIACHIINHINTMLGGGDAIQEKFKVFCGISTGSIILSLLLSPHKAFLPEDVLHAYEVYAPRIFKKNILRSICTLNGLIGSRYSDIELNSVLKQGIGEGTLISDIKNENLLLLPVYDVNSANVSVIPSNSSGWSSTFALFGHPHPSFLLWHVVRAAVAAPTYFDAFDLVAVNAESTKDLWYKKSLHIKAIDAGIYSINPAMLTITSLLQRGVITCETDIRVVSIGCGEIGQVNTTVAERRNSGALSWVPHIIDLQFQSAAASTDAYISTLFKTGVLKGKYIRLNPTVGPASGITSELDQASPLFMRRCREITTRYMQSKHILAKLKEFFNDQ